MNRSPMRRQAFDLIRFLPVAASVLLVGSAQAHPGHGLFEHGPRHAFTSPFHLVLLTAMGLTMFLGAHLVRRRVPRRVLQSIGLIALTISVIGWSFAS
jgi:hypothetical protein